MALALEALFRYGRLPEDMQLLVVGAGEMGRWFARTSGADAVTFTDRDPAVARAAADAVDGARTAPLDGDGRFDVVCVAVPMDAVPDAIAEHAGLASEAVLDVSGEMRDSVAALEAHATGVERASLHPLFSATNAPGNVPVVVDCDGPALPEPELEGVLPEGPPDDRRVGPALDVLVYLLGVDRPDVTEVPRVVEDGVGVGHRSASSYSSRKASRSAAASSRAASATDSPPSNRSWMSA